MKKLIIIGAGGHGKVVADIAKLNGYDNIIFLDDNRTLHQCGDYPVIGNIDIAKDLDDDLFIAIGNINIRRELLKRFSPKKLVTLIHPKAIIAEDSKIGVGTVVMGGAVINSGTTIGNGVIINTSCSIDHDCFIDDYSHISVGSRIAGSVNIGKSCLIGIGSIIINNINICSHCTIGAGAVIIQDVNVMGTYVGVPAKKLNNSKYI